MHLKKMTIDKKRFPVTDRYPFHVPAFRNAEEIRFASGVTFFVGENGSGKSTLLKAIAKKCGIYLWQDDTRSRFEYNPYENSFDESIDIEWADGSVPGGFFGSQGFDAFARILDSWASDDPGQLKYFGGKSLVTMSHGQSLMAFFSARYAIKGIYFLDEPETALSPKTQLELLSLLGCPDNSGRAQFVIATHSPILLSLPGSVIYNFGEDSIEPIRYRDTEQFRVYKGFFETIG